MIIRPYPPQGGSGFPHASYRVEGPAPNADTGGTRVRVYTYDNIMSWRGKRGHLRRKYIYGPGVDEPVCMIEAAGSYAGTYYYHFDGLGSVVGLTNASGNTVEVYEYETYGRVGATDASHPNRILFTGREYDKETGLYYYRARYYNPQIGRFLQTDPVGYGAGMNLYAYCENGPVNAIDPDGLQTIYVLQEQSEGLYFFYKLTEATDGTEWNLAGVADVFCVDPNRLKPVEFLNFGSGYVIQGVGTGYSNPGGGGTAGNREYLFNGPVGHFDSKTGPLDAGAANTAQPPQSAAPGGPGEGGGGEQLPGLAAIIGAAGGGRYANEGKTVKEILEGKRASIRNAPLPKGTPSWESIMDMEWRDIVEKAKTNRGFATIKKLLTDGRFNK